MPAIEEMTYPERYLSEMSEYCNCCSLCGQTIPCDGVLCGGHCDDLCVCDELNDIGYDENED